GEPLLRGSKTLVLAAYLAERPNRSATREHLAALFWPAVPSSQARRSLRQALYYLAQSGGEGILESDGELVRLAPDCCPLDAQQFERALVEDRFEDAVELYTGPFLQGYNPGKSRELAHWIESVRERLQVGYRQALRESARTALVRGDPERAVQYARRAADTFPLDDSIHALLLEALTAAARPGEAVREYEAYRVLLHEELEDVPSGDITEIAERARELVLHHPEDAATVPGVQRPGLKPDPPIDRRRPRSEPPTGPVGFLLRAALLVTVTAAILLFGLRWTGWSSIGSSGTPGAGAPVDEPSVHVRADLRVSGGTRHITLEFAGESPVEATILPGSESDLERLELQSPDGRLEAVRVPTRNGHDIEIVDVRTGELVASVPNRDGRIPDDHVHSWSPDSRVLLFSSGLLDEGGEYDNRLFLFDVESETVRPLLDRRVAGGWNRAWSPRGDWIVFEAFREGGGHNETRTDIYLVSVDGSRITALTDDDARETNVSWSPDGTRLVYRKGEIEAADIHVLELESGNVVAVADSDWPEREPIWISADEVAWVMMTPDGNDIWVARADGSTRPRQVTNGLDFIRLRQRLGPRGSEPWIESVQASAAGPDGILSPGEHSLLDVEVLDADGAPVHPDAAGLEWRVLDPSRAAIHENRQLAVTDTGTIRVVADVGGWRADTLVLESRPLQTSDVELLFEERWDRGLQDVTWQTFGTPEPTVRMDGGPEGGGVFNNRGDETGSSGALTNSRFSTADGLTVEVWGRVPLTGAQFQTWDLDVSGRTLRQPATGERFLEERAGWIQLISEGANRSSTALLMAPPLHAPFPEPDRIDEWRLHILQVHPDGTVEWIIDGKRHASIRSDQPVPDSVHVAIGGRTVATDVEHGTLRVWRGLRYEPVRD
ncbi:MAG: PD40 domain-containing protein, partial [Gemmatimonadetes bacterium]|nr:PD40 domain-containing protein [Gemmatimonadota bacterium]